MPIYTRKPEHTFEPCPEGLHRAVCVDVVDMGLVPTPWGDKSKVQLRWQVEEVNTQGRRFEVRKMYTNSLGDKANLRKDLESWRGRKFTEGELAGFDLERLLGANAQIQVMHNVTGDGGIFANVAAIVPAPPNAPRLAPADYVREQDRPKPLGAGGKPASPEDDDADMPF